MHDLHKGVLSGEVLVESVGQIHRAMLAAGTTYRNGQIAAVILLKFWNPAG